LIENAGVSVRLLRERRTALISAAVTGRIDVLDRELIDADLTETRAAAQPSLASSFVVK